MKMNRSRGFTLIELLVVISIIGLLSSVVLASLSTARARGRDAKRIQDLIQIRTALELYRDDNNRYPSSVGGVWNGYSDTAGGVCVASWYSNQPSDNWIPGLAPKYIPILPLDPKPNYCKHYMYISDGTGYKLISHQTIENFNANYSLVDPGYGTTVLPVPCSSSRPNSYSIYTPTYRCY